MKTPIKVPTLSESISEVTITQWFKKPGDAVVADDPDDPLLELETDKANMEVTAPVSGVLTEIVVKADASVTADAILGFIDAGGVAATPSGEAAGESVASAAAAPSAPPPAPPAPVAAVGSAADAAGESRPLSPAAGKLAREHAIDAATIAGSGKDGRVLKSDVLAAAETPTRTPAAAPALVPVPASGAKAGEERVPMSKLRRAIARRLKDAQNTAASLSTFNEVDMSAVIATRKRHQERFQARHGIKLGFMGFFVKACVSALRDIPALNAKIDGEDIVYRNHCNISVAVATEGGLLTPVVREAQDMSLAEIETAIGALAQKAREGRLQLSELQNGTFTITNGGLFGSMLSTPILNMPQSGILGMHAIQERAVVRGGEVVVRPMMYLALSYDHRIVDGREAVTFLVRVKENIEDPRRLLLDV